jgi:Nif-specific regulatory protein
MVVTLGRHRDNTIVLQDRHASRQHAEIFHVNGCWFIRDCDTLNGTRVNGERIRQATALLPGSEISIGDTRLRFELRTIVEPPTERVVLPADEPTAELGQDTILLVDELSALCGFMTSAVEESSERMLIERALTLILNNTRARLTGFLSLDPENPLPKVVLPRDANVDVPLSRELTQRVQRGGRLVWLGTGNGEIQSESLLAFRDALCAPLSAGGEPFGALHVYRVSGLFNEREVRFCEVLAGYLAANLRALRERRSLAAENSRMRGRPAEGAHELLGNSADMQQLRTEIGLVAPRPCTVLIAGETGVGKELVAKALHRRSTRRNGPFIPVNCAAITATLAESALFGHREGSFTGAVSDHAGFFEQADDGTIFLDEIGDMPLELQAKLLRVLEDRSFRPIGGKSDIRVDVRVVAATHQDLDKFVAEGKFRKDLYFRLKVVTIKVPALRTHPEDIPELAEHFLRQLQQDYHRPLRLTDAAMLRLQAYSWPGNVRELLALLEGAAALSEDEVLDVRHLRLPDDCGKLGGEGPANLNLDSVEEWAVRQALKRTQGNQLQAAELLGIHRDTLATKMKKYTIKRDEF